VSVRAVSLHLGSEDGDGESERSGAESAQRDRLAAGAAPGEQGKEGGGGAVDLDSLVALAEAAEDGMDTGRAGGKTGGSDVTLLSKSLTRVSGAGAGHRAAQAPNLVDAHASCVLEQRSAQLDLRCGLLACCFPSLRQPLTPAPATAPPRPAPGSGSLPLCL
jgi:hypothetical protein